MDRKRTLVLGSVILAAIFALPASSYARDRTGRAQSARHAQGMMMRGDMMARMSKMMDRCEKMMGRHDMQRGMRHHKMG